MLQLFGEICWFLVPAGAANMAPIFAAKVFPNWKTPVDFGYSVNNIRLFGDHKTVRGLVAGTITGGITFLLLRHLMLNYAPVSMIPRAEFLGVTSCFGFWIGFCALVGDLAKSFFKRQRKIPPGKSWVPFDQVDWGIGAVIGCLPFLPLSAGHIVPSLLIALILSVSVKVIGYLFRLNETPI
jgi:hypothetical protein